MQPIGPLMIEHRLIERMIGLMSQELERIRNNIAVDPEFAFVDPVFIDTAVDFLRIYADRCHHGKEEDILFAELAAKDLADVVELLRANSKRVTPPLLAELHPVIPSELERILQKLRRGRYGRCGGRLRAGGVGAGNGRGGNGGGRELHAHALVLLEGIALRVHQDLHRVFPALGELADPHLPRSDFQLEAVASVGHLETQALPVQREIRFDLDGILVHADPGEGLHD